MKNVTIFIWVSKAIRDCFGLLYFALWLVENLAPPFKPKGGPLLKPLSTWLPAFSRALGSFLGCLRYFPSSDWLVWLRSTWFWFYDTQSKSAPYEKWNLVANTLCYLLEATFILAFHSSKNNFDHGPEKHSGCRLFRSNVLRFVGVRITVFVWSLGILLCRCTWHFVCSGLYCVSVCGISHDAVGEVYIQRRQLSSDVIHDLHSFLDQNQSTFCRSSVYQQSLILENIALACSKQWE